jgi:uncharacterized membrane protein
MLENLLPGATFIAALGAALVAGIFFAFSNFVMGALGRIAPEAGISAMQSINVVVLNPVFLGLFMGTAALSFLLAVGAFLRWSEPGAVCLLAGSVLYLAGCFLVTIMGNVPLNDSLAAVNASSDEGQGVWAHYLSAWTWWNTVRTIASLAASAAFIAALAK